MLLCTCAIQVSISRIVVVVKNPTPATHRCTGHMTLVSPDYFKNILVLEDKSKCVAMLNSRAVAETFSS